jgi:hypothetical protein
MRTSKFEVWIRRGEERRGDFSAGVSRSLFSVSLFREAEGDVCIGVLEQKGERISTC